MPRPRSLARRLAMQYLFMADLQGFSEVESPEVFLREHAPDEAVFSFALELVQSVLAHREALDRRIREVAEHWDLSRIAAVERNILRLACGELEKGETPPRVVLDEAITLAKIFGGKDSGSFVNGVLERLAAPRLHEGRTS